MELGQCGWKTKGKRCPNVAHQVRDIPSRGWLSRQAVCDEHARLLDARRERDRRLVYGEDPPSEGDTG